MKNQWKEISGYRKKYKINTIGLIKDDSNRLLKGCIKFGYRVQPLTKEDGSRVFKRVHRLIWETFVGEIQDGYVIDHIDGNRLNNALSNLRVATRQQNSVNRGAMVKNKTGFRGVVRKGTRFIAQITSNYTVTYLGTFDTPEQAGLAYQTRAKEVHGNFYSGK